MPRSILLASSVALLIPILALAQPRPLASPKDDPPPADSKFALTIYSTADPATFDPQQSTQDRQADPAYRIPGYGVVRETRKITLVAGDNQIKFTNVAAGIDPTTVSFKSLTAPDSTAILEQNFEYDIVSPDKLLEKYLGKSVIINRKQESRPGERTLPETIEARLLSFTPDQLVLETNNRQLPVQMIPRNHDITEIKLFELKTGLITKPTLVWKLNTDRPGDHDVLVSYQTDNITWRADYMLVVNKDDAAADLSSWVTLVNESGAAYPDARLKLIAGDVRRLRAERQVFRGGMGGGGALAAGADTGFKEKSFFEYHLYTLGRPTSVANNSTKQIELFPAKANLPVTKTYVYYGFEPEYGFAPQGDTNRDVRGRYNKKVDVYLQLKNSEKNGLGIPLPAGRIRVYKRDDADPQQQGGEAGGTPEFIGEDKIDHTPKDEALLVRIGSAFDITGERRQTNFTQDGNTITESFEIKLRNHKKDPVNVLVKENLYRWSQWEITASSDKFDKHDSRAIHIPIQVKPDEEKTVSYTVKYTW
jgi:hypothetical protein